MITAPERLQGAIHPRHGWLAAAIPVSARRFRVADPELAVTLTSANGEIVDSHPDVEILAAHQLCPNAPWVVVNADHAPAATGRNNAAILAKGASRRIAASLGARTEARMVRRRLLQFGYRRVVLLPWDLEQPLRLPNGPDHEQLRVVERFPRSVLVLGMRGTREATALETVMQEATEACAGPMVARPLVRESGLIVVGSSEVLRVTVGPGARALDAQERALGQLHRAPSDVLARRIPQILYRRRTGLADWSLEGKLVGRQPVCPLPSSTLRDCLEFLVALHLVRDGGGAGGPAGEARTVADACTAQDAGALSRLGLRLESRLRAIPRGFGHGDFWGGNLLVDCDGRLTGVIDWEHAAAGRLPLLDLLHLELNADRPPSPDHWGTAVVDRLLPWARAGGNEFARSYCERIGLTPTAPLFVQLVVAYWVNRLAVEVGTYSDRRLRRRWMRNNLELVLRVADALVG